MSRLIPILVALSLLPAHAADLDEAVARFLAAADAKQRAAAIDAIVALRPSAEDVVARLKRGRTYKAVETGWSVEDVRCSDDIERSYHRYVPKGYDPTKPMPVLVDLHGGVSRADPIADSRFGGRRALWQDQADEAGMMLIVPKASKGAEWWSPVGSDALMRILAATRRTHNVDENRVHVTGFSDGASGAFYLALYHPTVFASAVPLNGHIAVAQAASRKPIYLPTLRQTPLYVINGTRDRLYPAAQVKPFMDAVKRAGVDLTYVVHDVGHDMNYADTEKPKILAFLRKHARAPHPERLAFETIAPGARCHWLQIDTLGRVPGESKLPDVNVTFTPRLQLGIRLDDSHTGAGVKVSSVTAGTLAQRLDLRKGDVIVAADEKKITDVQTLIGVLRGKKWGDRFKVAITRGETAITLAGTFVQPPARSYFTRPRPAGRVDVARDGNMIVAKTRGVRRFSLLLAPGIFDLSQPIDVMVNGKLRSLRARPDVRWLLQQAARDDDRTMCYAARLTVDVAPPPAEKKAK